MAQRVYHRYNALQYFATQPPPPISILCSTDNGILFFEPTLLKNIEIGNNAECLSTLEAANYPVELIDSSGKTLLHFAAQHGNKTFAEYLIDLGAKVNAQDQTKRTPLMLAVELNRTESVGVLLDAGADIFLPDTEGQCTLGIALRKSGSIHEHIYAAVLNQVTVESLQASKYVASYAFHKDCPLDHFMYLRNVELTKTLLDKGSPVNARNRCNGGITALHEAVRSNCLETVKLLLRYGADVNAEDQRGSTPFELIWLYESSSEVMIKVLVGAGAKLFNPVSRRLIAMNVLTCGTREMVRSVLPFLDLHVRDVYCTTPLHYLAENYHPDILEELRHSNFDVNVRSQDRSTMLHYAAFAGNASSVKFLLDHGADANARDSSDKTALFFVADPSYMYSRNGCNDYVNCIEILIDHGADVQLFIKENTRVMRVNHHLISDELIRPIFAKLVLLEASGRPIDTSIRHLIESYERFKRILDSVALQLEGMKQVKVDHSMTLFDFMVTNEISWFSHNKKLISSLKKIIKNFSVASCYRYMLQERFLKFKRLLDCRKKFELAVNEVLTEFSNLSVCNVAEKIVDFLQDNQWIEIS